ncbi:unnamed protein product [Lactuca saligna]|uniref:Uncharacterized protein n=1 Tax=Lactuca saligna TaxID=75948 RepID=A0AA35ZUX4_LACSI|nr:unnamed protein product [Lactuca saligna]
MDLTTHLVAHGGPATIVTSNNNNSGTTMWESGGRRRRGALQINWHMGAQENPIQSVGLGSCHNEHIVTNSGAMTTTTNDEAATIEIIPMVAAVGDLCSDLVSNKALGQKGGTRLLASVVLLVGD